MGWLLVLDIDFHWKKICCLFVFLIVYLLFFVSFRINKFWSHIYFFVTHFHFAVGMGGHLILLQLFFCFICCSHYCSSIKAKAIFFVVLFFHYFILLLHPRIQLLGEGGKGGDFLPINLFFFQCGFVWQIRLRCVLYLFFVNLNFALVLNVLQ